MIVYGSRMYFKSNVVKAFGTCEHCGNYGKNKSYQARKFGHIYFIPLIPMGGKAQVIRECSSCSMGAHLKKADLDVTLDSLSEQFKSWITSLSEGQTEIVLEEGGQPTNIGYLIVESVEDLYCLKEIESIDAIQSMLNSNGMRFENEIVTGRWSELKGNLEEAKQRYISAQKISPDDPIASFNLGMVNLKLKNTAEAETEFKKYLVSHPDDKAGVYVELATAFEQEKNFPKIVEAYDVIYELNPNVVSDKAMKKVYKKACKKSGVQGKFLAQM